MDKIIETYLGEEKDGHFYCHDNGVAYQVDMDHLKEYGEKYYHHYKKISGSDIAKKLNRGRIDIVSRHIQDDGIVLDIGIGSGEFIKTRNKEKGKVTWGTDVNPYGVEWLKKNKCLVGKDYDIYDAFCFWDSLEHIPEPEYIFNRLKDNSWVFISMPIYEDIKEITKSKHFKPGEHVYYFTENGLIDWMGRHRFTCYEVSNFEEEAGREGIKSFAFKKDGLSYRDTIGQYKEKHSTMFYGSTGSNHLDEVLKLVQSKGVTSILDYGCGRSDLVAYLYKDGERRVERHDPAIPKYKEIPEGSFGLVTCTDVLEHLNIKDIPRLFKEINMKSDMVYYSISMVPARAKLPNGMNAHITVMPFPWWDKFLRKYYGRVDILSKTDRQFTCVCRKYKR